VVCFIIFFFLRRVTGDPLTGFAAALALVSSSGYLCRHGTRTGEYDAFLTLFVLIFSISIFLLTEDVSEKRKRQLWGTFTLGVILAILTKGIAALMITPGLFIYVLLRRKLLWFLRSKETYISFFCILFIGAGYYLLREHFNPGFLTAVNKNELGGRYVNTNEGHEGSFLFYINLIKDLYFVHWLPLVAVALIAVLISGMNSIVNRLIAFCVLVASGMVAVVSLGATKLVWYSMPAMPFLAIAAGLGVYLIRNYIFEASERTSPFKRELLSLLFVLFIAASPYITIVADDLNDQEINWDIESHSIGHYVNEKIARKASLDGYKILKNEYEARIVTCSIYRFEALGQHMHLAEAAQLQKGDRLIIHNDHDREIAGKLFKHLTIEQFKTIEIWLLGNPQDMQ
jgi:4-amino-4-deoxy-L-arabinose transferase-like glycosyltransferase